MQSPRILVGVSVFIGSAVIASLFLLSADNLSGYGSIISAGGSLLAVLWFSAGLHYQSIQLKEQREQFSQEFKHLQEATKRDALLMCQNILNATEDRVVKIHGGISSSSELIKQYMILDEISLILNSTDPLEVLATYQLWIKKEGAVSALLNGIKSAAEIYLRSIGVSDIDYSKKPEEFVQAYGCWFLNLPFFNSYEGTASVISQFMLTLGPGRDAATIAFFAAQIKLGNSKYLKMKEINEMMSKHKGNGYDLPKIAEDL